MRNYKWIIFLCMFFVVNIAVAYDSGHIYISGTVNYIYKGTIKISSVNYKIDQNFKVVIVYKQNDSFHERPGKLSDIRTGDFVTAKMIGGVIYEIIVEEWKR